jgi:hypothetical protein
VKSLGTLVRCLLNDPKNLPKFFGNDGTTIKENMSNFWDVFPLNPIDDESEYVVMKLISLTGEVSMLVSLIKALRPWNNLKMSSWTNGASNNTPRHFSSDPFV